MLLEVTRWLHVSVRLVNARMPIMVPDCMKLVEARIPIYIAIFFGIIFAVIVGNVGAGIFGNPLSTVAPIIAIGLWMWGTIDYRKGLIILIILSAFLDFAKRLLLFNGEIAIEDVAKVLLVAPVTLVGLLIGSWVPAAIFRKRKFARHEVKVIWIFIGAFALLGLASYIQTKNSKDVMTALGQCGIYMSMVIVAYSLYAKKSICEIKRLLLFIQLIFLPVALYGLWQVMFGYNQFEIDYMMTGLTITYNLLFEPYTRPFSTLNSPQAYGTMMWFLMVISFYQWRSASNRKGLLCIVWIIYLVADLFSTTRGSTVFSLVSLPFLYWFTSKRKTLAVYGFLGTVMLILVLNAQWLLNNLSYLDSLIPKSGAFSQQMLNIQTMSERLQGYVNVLGNPESWSLLGDWHYRAETAAHDENYNHDALSQLLLQFGIVGVGCIFGLITWAAVIIHSRVFKIRDEKMREMASLMLVLMVFFLFSNLFGKGFQVFPINMYFFLFVGLLLSLCFHEYAGPAEIMRNDEKQSPSFRGRRRRSNGFQVASSCASLKRRSKSPSY